MRPGLRLYVNVMIQLSFREYHIYIVSAQMERFRQMARELNINMLNQGIACLPKNNRKCAGSVTRAHRAGGNVAWVLRIRQGDFRYQRTFSSEAEANNQMCDTPPLCFQRL